MSDLIINDLSDVLDNYLISTEDKNKIKEYEKAMLDFEKMVKAGIVKKRGYNLSTIEDQHVSVINFNTSLQPTN